MNCMSNRTFLSFLPAGALLSFKNQFSLGRSIRPKLIHHQIVTHNQSPSKKTPGAPATFGQPTHSTHPHRIKKGEIVPGITVEEFKERRHNLLKIIKRYCSRPNASSKTLLIVIPSTCKKYMTENIPYVFRQNSDFLYLTGCLEEDSLLVLISKNNKDESIIFVRERDPHSELWDGPRTGVDQAVELFGVDKAMSVKEFSIFVDCFLKDNKDCMVWYDYKNDIHHKVHTTMQHYIVGESSKAWDSPKRFIHQLRLFKSPAEQELIKKSCKIGSRAIKMTMKDSRPWDEEAFIQARVDFHCRMDGAEYLAYPPVVAAGNRANIIHYIDNNHVAEEGDLVLMDAGCEYHGYCSDISRTWPISGRFTPAQRTLYEVVYSVQMDLIQTCSHFPSLDELYFLMNKLLEVRLKEAGIFLNKAKVEGKDVNALCPHHVGHYLGMDVHDTGTVVRNIPLEPGMVCTIEPGVYVSKTNKLVNPEYHGLGIRIEDDILMTSSGPLVLTSSCPKHPDDIEELHYS